MTGLKAKLARSAVILGISAGVVVAGAAAAMPAQAAGTNGTPAATTMDGHAASSAAVASDVQPQVVWQRRATYYSKLACYDEGRRGSNEGVWWDWECEYQRIGGLDEWVLWVLLP